MELEIQTIYNQILRKAQKLPLEMRQRLVEAMQSSIGVKKKGTKKDLEQLILNAPTWGEEDLKRFEEARAHINTSRIA